VLKYLLHTLVAMSHTSSLLHHCHLLLLQLLLL
jgi:hypothetical protein